MPQDKAYRARLGNCYELSANFVISNPDWELVHGYIKADPRIWPTASTAPNDHAWCEMDEFCYDPVLAQLFTKDGYYRMFGAVPQQRYNYPDARKKLLETANYGPWED
jgi:hypothetical protein